MSKSDGSVRIDTTLDTEGVKKGAKEIKEDLEGVKEDIEGVDSGSEQASESIGGSFASSFTKLGKAIAAAQIAEKLYEFSKEAIELGSDLEEVQNVVDVTFETMSDSVNQFAKDAQKTAGLSEKMAKQYVGTFGAMADSFGFTEAEAYEMSTALTQLTGDVASFYNLSQDEAMNKLKGVFTGETEALKELGVVMTQAALDNYALANGYEKTTSAMTEQEKVALRYQFVMDQLSASSGDFVRTQDSWANQSKILSLQWESLMATLGSGMIDVLTPGMEFLNDEVLPALGRFAERFAEAMEPTPSEELAKSLKKLNKSVESSNEQFQETAQNVEVNAELAQRYKERLENLESSSMDSAAAQAEYAAIVGYLNEIYPEMNLQIDKQTGMLDTNSRAQLANLDAVKQRALLAAQEAQYQALADAWAEAYTALATAETSLIQIEEQRALLIDEITAKTGLTIEQLKEMYDTQSMQASAMAAGNGAMADAVTVIGALSGASASLTKEQMDLLEQIFDLDAEEKKLNKTIEDGKKTVDKYEQELNTAADTLGEVEDASKDLVDAQGDVSTSVAETQTALQELETEYANAKESARASIDSQIGLFDELVVKSDKSAADIVKNWESQRIAFDNYSANLQKAIDMGLDEALVKQLSDGSQQSMAILQEFVTSTDVSVDDINEAFRKTEESKETVSTTMAEIQTDMAGKLGDIEEDIRTSWDNASLDVKRAIKQMQSDINSLQGRTVTIQIRTSGSTSGKDMSLSNPSNRSYTPAAANVPYLASGAVIPPNAPFMAVLGDQRHGTNVEAPLSTIQEAVSNVVEGAILSGFAAMIKEQKATQEILKNIEIGDTVIGQAVDRYNEMNNIIRGGSL